MVAGVSVRAKAPLTTRAPAAALHRRVPGYRCESMPGRHGIDLRQWSFMPASMCGVYWLR